MLDMLLTRVRPSWYMAGFMALWAVVSALTALSTDFKGLLLTRFFLGVTGMFVLALMSVHNKQ